MHLVMSVKSITPYTRTRRQKYAFSRHLPWIGGSIRRLLPKSQKGGQTDPTYRPTTYSAKEASVGAELRGNMQACVAWDAWHTVSNPSGLKGEQPSSHSLWLPHSILAFPIPSFLRPPLDDFYDPWPQCCSHQDAIKTTTRSKHCRPSGGSVYCANPWHSCK